MNIDTLPALSIYCCFIGFAAIGQASPLVNFASWQQKDLVGTNQYQFSVDMLSPMVRITSRHSASGLFLKQKINLNQTPLINFSWKISHILNIDNERIKSGDDFSARVYIITSSGPFPWQKKSLSYVWSNRQKVGLHWDNPYTDKVKMIAVDSGAQFVGTWRQHTRNVQQDLQRAFGRRFTKIDVIAIMTDTDNSKQQATAWYKDFSFSAP